MSNDLKTLAENILKFLDGRKQSWLADKTELTQPQISRILNGKTDPPIGDVIAIANALGRSIDELVGKTSADLSSEELKLLKAFRKASILRKAAAMAYATAAKEDAQAYKDLSRRMIDEYQALQETESKSQEAPEPQAPVRKRSRS